MRMRLKARADVFAYHAVNAFIFCVSGIRTKIEQLVLCGNYYRDNIVSGSRVSLFFNVTIIAVIVFAVVNWRASLIQKIGDNL